MIKFIFLLSESNRNAQYKYFDDDINIIKQWKASEVVATLQVLQNASNTVDFPHPPISPTKAYSTKSSTIWAQKLIKFWTCILAIHVSSSLIANLTTLSTIIWLYLSRERQMGRTEKMMFD